MLSDLRLSYLGDKVELLTWCLSYAQQPWPSDSQLQWKIHISPLLDIDGTMTHSDRFLWFGLYSHPSSEFQMNILQQRRISESFFCYFIVALFQGLLSTANWFPDESRPLLNFSTIFCSRQNFFRASSSKGYCKNFSYVCGNTWLIQFVSQICIV